MGCVDKQRNPVSDISYSVINDTIVSPYTENDGFEFLEADMLNDTAFVVFRNKRSDTLFFCFLDENLKSLKCIQRLKILDTTLFSNSDSLGIFQDIDIINKDSILFTKYRYLGSSSRLFIYSLVKNRVVFEKSYLSDEEYPNCGGDTTELWFIGEDVKWDSRGNRILSFFVTGLDKEAKDCFLLSISAKDGQRQILPFTYPDVYNTKPKEIYPFKDMFDFEIIEDGTIYTCFGVSPEIYIIRGDSCKAVEVLHPNYSKPLIYYVKGTTNGDEFLNVATHSFAYLNFLYDKYNQCFYRFYDIELPERDENGMKSLLQNKQTGFSVLSKDLKSIQECVITEAKDNEFAVATMVSKNGILFIKTEQNRIIVRTLKIQR